MVLDPLAEIIAPYLRIIHGFFLNLSSLYRANTLVVLLLKARTPAVKPPAPPHTHTLRAPGPLPRPRPSF